MVGLSFSLLAIPDTAEYSVTTQDSAQITRMRHVTLKMDIKGWEVNWATENGIDARGIGYVQGYPEMIENGGERTNLRTYGILQLLKRYPDTYYRFEKSACY